MVDQRRIDNQRSRLDARAAASRLGVDVRTLYAYAARGLVRSYPGGQGRKHVYEREDIERLLARKQARSGHGAVAAGALRFGEPVLDSAITALTPAGIRYCGHGLDALLSAQVPYERVAELLWTGALPTETTPMRAAALPWSRIDAVLPERATVLPRLGAIAAVLAADSGRAEKEPLAAARTIIATLAIGLAGRDPARARQALRGSSLAASVALALGRDPRPELVDAIDVALVVSADHELNASTFAVRVAASTGASLAACVATGLQVMTGPRHGGASRLLEDWLRRAGPAARVAAHLREHLRRGESVPGFGHPLYPAGDPRAVALLARAARLRSRGARWRGVQALVEAMARNDHDAPNLDAGLVALGAALSLPLGTVGGLFALGRCAGWIAHALEQRAAGFLLRPRARYVGA